MSQGARGFSVSLSNTWFLDVVTWGIRAKKSPSTRRGFSVLLKGTLTACTHINTALSRRAYSLLLFMYCRHSYMAPVDPFSRFSHNVLFLSATSLHNSTLYVVVVAEVHDFFTACFVMWYTCQHLSPIPDREMRDINPVRHVQTRLLVASPLA